MSDFTIFCILVLTITGFIGLLVWPTLMAGRMCLEILRSLVHEAVQAATRKQEQ